MSVVKDFETEHFPTWCPGCGNFGIWVSMKQAIVNLGYAPHELVLVFGVGCSGNMSNFINVYGFHGLHGRPVPVAEGIRAANSGIKVLATGGDGDGYGEGLGHFIHTMRGNWDMTYVVHNNQVYGLTTGQTSPTSMKGFQTKSTPSGVVEVPVNPLALAITSGATFVARGFAGDAKHLTSLIEQGMRHKGFSFIDVLQPCVTFNRLNTYQWFTERVYKLEEKEGYDPKNKMMALEKTFEDWNKNIPTGVFYLEDKPSYEDNFAQLSKGPLVKNRVDTPLDVSPLMEDFR